ncbi:DUF5908 family protein [Cellulomonas sp. URHE0023]|uniref:DUF5908 family protein n=1 Tax=Cellulomonas sp. URHE0023 TaxID=1380354 RepID=UPI00047F685B|nr:DUF5908 family protein [Cellulomonas sp. URHE0023]
MPIEIKELHIRVSVTAPAGTAAPPAGAPTTTPGTDGASRQALVAELVEQVLQVLDDRKER